MADRPAEDRALSALELCRRYGARILDPADVREWAHCVKCGVGMVPDPQGVPRACVQCSCAEVGETWPGLAHRVSHHLTLSAWRKLATVADVPPLSYRDWRRRHFGR